MNRPAELEVTDPFAAAMAEQDVRGRSLWVDAWHRLLKNKAAVVSGIIMFVIPKFETIFKEVGGKVELPALTVFMQDFSKWLTKGYGWAYLIAAIPILYGINAIHGNSNIRGATVFPHNIGLGASNEPELIRKVARITAREVLACGLDWIFAPNLAVAGDIGEGGGEIGVLERAATPHLRRHLAREGQHRRTIGLGVVEPGEQIGRAGPRDAE